MSQSVSGRFTIRLFKDGKWHLVTIDDYLPVKKDGILAFGKCKDPSEFWVPLLEKAYAKLNGSYRSLEWGSTAYGLVDLTGGVGFGRKISPKDSESNELWEFLCHSNEDDYFIGCSLSRKGEEKETESKETGLVGSHAYAVLKCVTVNDTKLVQIRNPWGKKEWFEK